MCHTILIHSQLVNRLFKRKKGLPVPRLRFYLLLGSILLASLLPLIQAQVAVHAQQLTTVPIIENDDEQVRSVINEYFDALRSKDWVRLDAIETKRQFEVIMNGSDSHGPLLPFNVSIELTKRLLTPYKIETLSFTIDKLVIEKHEATSHVRVNISAREPDTGAKVIDFTNLTRVLHLERCQCVQGRPWRLNLDTANGASLESQIKSAATLVERQFLYSQENLSELNTANAKFKKEGAKLLEQERLNQAFTVFEVAQEIDDHIRHRSTVGAEMRSTQREAAIAQFRASSQHKDLAMNLLWAGQDYAELNDYSRAEIYVSESISLLEPLEDRQSLAKASKEMAAIYLEQGKYSQAANSYQNSIDNYMLVAAAEDKKVRSFTVNELDDLIIGLAYLYSAQGKYELAEKFVSSISEKLKTLGATEDAMMLNYITAILEMARGDSAQAIKSMEHTLLEIENSSHKIEDQDEVVAGINFMLTILYIQQGNFTIAAQRFEKIRHTRIKAQVDNDVEGWDNLLQFMDGMLYGAQGNEGLMVSRFKKAMPAMTRAGLEDLSVPDILLVLGISHMSRNAFSDVDLPQEDINFALQCFQFSASLAEKSGDKVRAARGHQFISMLYGKKQIHSKEIEHFVKGLSFLEDGDLPFKDRFLGQSIVDNILLNAGGIYSEMGNDVEAIKTYQKIFDSRNLRLFKFFEQMILLRIAEAYYALGNFNETTKYAAESVLAATRSGDSDTLRNAYLLAGNAHRSLGEPELARKSYQAAINEVEASRSRLSASDQSAAQLFENQVTPYQAMVKLLLSEGKIEDAFSYSEQAKSKVLLDILKNGKKNIALSLTTAEQQQEYDLRRRLIVLNRQVIRAKAANADDSAIRELRNQRVEARLDYELFRSRLNVTHPELREHLTYAREIFKPEDVGSLLTSPSDAILEFMVTEKKTYLFVLTKKNRAETVQIGNPTIPQDIEYKIYEIEIEEDQLKNLINDFRVRVSNPEGILGRQANELYERLLGKAQEQLAGKKLLIIVPDGILWNLPFQALKPTEGPYLLEKFAIYFAPSLTALREMQKLKEQLSQKDKRVSLPSGKGLGPSPMRNPALLVVGNPSVCENRNCNKVPLLPDTFDSLPGSELLARKLYDLYGPRGSINFSNKIADEATIKRKAVDYQVIHISAHGVLDNDNPMYSFLVLSQLTRKTSNNNLRGKQIGVEDGFLEAWELMDLKLKAEMIVLSSCDTARGQVRKGEGIVGFSWAALMAGCPTVIAGQWQVDETSTNDLMYDFHKNWKEERAERLNVNVASALQRSSLTLLRSKKYSHPYYWAGFTVIGVGH